MTEDGDAEVDDEVGAVGGDQADVVDDFREIDDVEENL